VSVFLLFFLILKSERFNERTERLVVVVVIDREKSAGCRGGGFIFRAHLSTFVVYVVVYVVEGIFGGGGGKEGGVSSAYFFVKEAKKRLKQQKREREREKEREKRVVRVRKWCSTFYAIRNNHH
jgi:phage tail tape-measure protein|tara:strand:+ start:80 stop:451 length:372 start_codon:yes stop_codon:yes gene_type:complete